MAAQTIDESAEVLDEKFEEEIVLENHERAGKVVNKYIPFCAGAALIPVPGVDLAAITGIHVKMIADISKIYGIPFSEDAAKNIISSFIAAAIPSSMGFGLTQIASSMLKVIPGLGTILGMGAGAAFAAAFTFALGRVFIQHFESGGNLITLDPTAAGEYFKNEFNSAMADQKSGDKKS